eukprot:TRINITY_DN46203_c0_g1_i1.p1 TRINITY_DN46203_c0_g1~~TRINITY_DN46203_c0_g1_i1.p1  ORF type:complete len:279 (+),score=63.72 TRINITY_DN46203_c0_g1_i1:213-1049(+)
MYGAVPADFDVQGYYASHDFETPIKRAAGGGSIDLSRLLAPTFTAVCCLLFLAPTALCIYISQHPVVAYFGAQWCYILLLIPVIIGTVHWHHVRRRAPSKYGILTALCLPSALLLIIADGELSGARAKTEQLISTDCSSFGEKAALQASWEEAYAAFESCVADSSAASGVPASKVMKSFRLQDCEEYSMLLKKNKKPWSYLRYLEETQGCSGWCYPAQQIWSATPSRDSCSSMVSAAFSFFVLPHAEQVVSLSVMVLLSAAIGFAFLNPYMRALGIKW